VVEDDDSMRQAIERLLGAAGLQPVSYGSAEDALDGDAAERAVCVVSDLVLPAMSGLELLAELRARGVLAPLILITAHDKAGLGGAATQSGAAAYLVKPFAGTALLEAIRAVAGPRGTR
jgi:FixJ family two-component response regulator